MGSENIVSRLKMTHLALGNWWAFLIIFIILQIPVIKQIISILIDDQNNHYLQAAALPEGTLLRLISE